MPCFNSKLVRLKAEAPPAAGQVFIKFQFQTGAIKRYTVHLQAMPQSRFNSKLVRLKGGHSTS